MIDFIDLKTQHARIKGEINAARPADTPLWARDKRPRTVALDLGFAHAERSPNIGRLTVDLEHA